MKRVSLLALRGLIRVDGELLVGWRRRAHLARLRKALRSVDCELRPLDERKQQLIALRGHLLLAISSTVKRWNERDGT